MGRGGVRTQQVSLEHPGILVRAHDPIDHHVTNMPALMVENKSEDNRQQSDVRGVKSSTKDSKKKDYPPPLQSFMLLPPNVTSDVESAKWEVTRETHKKSY